MRLRLVAQTILGFLLVALVCPEVAGLDPSRKISQYGHSMWRIQDGYLPGPPEAITQTADGYLWIGTHAGLVRFDGVRFVPWASPKGEKLPSDQIHYLLGTSDGSLWIGTAGGLARWKDGILTTYKNLPTAFGASLRTMRETFGSQGGIAETDAARFVVFETATCAALAGMTEFLFRQRPNWRSMPREISGFQGMRDSANGSPEVRRCTSIENWPNVAT